MLAVQIIERRTVACVLVALISACSGDTLVLGSSMPSQYRFEPPEVVAELSVLAKADNPSLTADLLEIYFTASEVIGPGGEIWRATRQGAGEPFAAPERVNELRASEGELSNETSPIVSADGLTLWFASDRSGGLGDLDIWVTTRNARDEPWSAPENLALLNSAGKEIPRPPGQRQRVMPLASDREADGLYQIYFSERAELAAPFQAPSAIGALEQAGESTVDGFLTDDGLSLFYATGPAIGPAELYVASRRSTAEPFERPMPLAELNTEHDERDPWLSQDGTLFFFASDRSGRYAIYVARVDREQVNLAQP
jgi:hypothetical protein